ncbi:MAG: recombinase family protein [Clostridia bacterium]|nr:recombinase family protein [Clostridia bacterium]
MLRGVIYARYSSEKQNEQSIEGQIRENRAYAEKNGIRIVETYIDRAQSAKTDNRPEFQRMIRDSAKRGFDVVIVWKLDRFARNRYDAAKYKAALRMNKVKVISATEAIVEGSSGIILEAVLEGVAEAYSADLAERVLRGMTDNALKCRFNGAGSPPLGYNIDAEKHYQIDEKTAPIVREIFERYAAGEPRKTIISDLNARGLTTSRGKPFGQSGLHNMLKNRNYIGEYRYNGIVTPGGVPAIVPREVFDRVQARMKQNAHTPSVAKAPERYILTTKLFCGKCQTMMTGISTNKKNGAIYRYYKCNAAKRHECDMQTAPKDLIENAVISRLVALLNDRKTLKKLADKLVKLSKEENTDLPLLESRLVNTRKQIENLVNAVAAGITNRSTKAKLDELEAEEDRLLERIEEEKQNTAMLDRDHILFFFDTFRKLDLTIESNRERLVDALVGKILFNPDGKVTVFLNFSNDPITFDLDDSEQIGDIDGSLFLDLAGSPQT